MDGPGCFLGSRFSSNLPLGEPPKLKTWGLLMLTPPIPVPQSEVFFIIRLMLCNGCVWGGVGVGDVSVP